ncbi:tripartite tricarboxylate transporter substrate binding protein [Ramlibacter sp. XY19]|uniref:Bug family tripartite tricarboxylate transporter substrate binding protein n=1 Tax=Ramlibacter paludis TaxID=2908000 RepID=UPI0023DBDDF4|nr:tripartite tricarboxylate transporter substrate binding protein [Ramlibacter paludis]MCG2592915.1 tripartite tricarboxylate transporter substrate binding protein [Ramlibacter paludis]
MKPSLARNALAAAALVLAGLAAHAAEDAARFPSKVMTLVVPYAPGGSSDVRARMLAAKMSATLGQTIIVDNKAGAGGNIGTAAIAKAAPDGYTFGIGNFAPLSVNKAMMPRMPFDPEKDLAPIILIERGPLVLVVPEKSPLKTFNDLVAFGKANPDKVNFASAGTGGAYHLAGELLAQSTGVPMVHVPYKGGGPATTDLLAGQVTFMFDMAPAVLPHIKEHKMRALAVAHEKRLAQLPDVPTLGELGLKDMAMSNWFGLVAPKGTPPAIIAKLNDAANKALREPDVAQAITGPGNILAGGTPEQFQVFVNAETTRWGKVVRDKHITAE